MRKKGISENSEKSEESCFLIKGVISLNSHNSLYILFRRKESYELSAYLFDSSKFSKPAYPLWAQFQQVEMFPHGDW